MMISTKGRYALRVLIDMAEHQTDGYIPLKEIAKRQDISEKYLESIVKTLVKGGVPIKKVNIGNMHMSEGKRQVATSVAVNDEDVAAFKELQELGVELEIRRVPSTPVEDTSKLFS